MLHPIYWAVLRHPGLAATHLANYAALLRESAAGVAGRVALKVAAWTVVGVCVLLAFGLAGVATMLGMLEGRFHWVLVAVPGTALLAAAVAAALALRPAVKGGVDEVTAQLNADREAMDFATETKQ